MRSGKIPGRGSGRTAGSFGPPAKKGPRDKRPLNSKTYLKKKAKNRQKAEKPWKTSKNQKNPWKTPKKTKKAPKRSKKTNLRQRDSPGKTEFTRI
jgi:hypothetical protein